MNLSSFNIYDASAGSGKTYTIVKEYLKILFTSPGNEAYKHVLAITFTNKAVGEMKVRIIEALKAFSSEDILIKPSSLFNYICSDIDIAPEALHKKAKSILENIVHNYAAFDVSTIDKFTQKVIRTFAYDLQLPLNFEVELDTDSLLEKAINNLIARAGTEKLLTKVLIAFAIEKTNDNKSWDVAYDFNQIATLLINENHVPYIEQLKHKTLDDFKLLKQGLKEGLKQTKESLTKEAQDVLALIEQSGLEYADFSRGSLPKYFIKISQEDYSIKFDAVWQQNLLNGDTLYTSKATQHIGETIDAIQPTIAEAFSTTKQLLVTYKFLQNFYNHVTPLSVLNEIGKEIQKIKDDKNLLLISEFNSIISQHIKEQPAAFIYERIGERFKHYFIDEFQDTSVMQWENLIPLLENSLSGEYGSAMLVGDAKQAIYRWRGGKAEQFIDLYGGHSPFHVTSNIKRLPTNYRSHKQIIQFNNQFFKHLSSFVFSNPLYEDLYQNSTQEAFHPEEGFVDISFLTIDKDSDKHALYPEKVLETITSCLQNGYELNDICILVRKKAEGVAIADYLIDSEIDIISSETLLVNNSPEVQFITNLLKFILEPKNLQVKINVLSFIASHKLDLEAKHSFYKEFIHLDIDLFFAKLNEKGFNFNYHEALQLSVYEVIEAVIYGFHLAETSNAYIQFYLDFALEYANKRHSNLADFLSHYDTKKHALSIISPEGKNAVKIMTIHKSKGLEFPVVIFPYADLDIYKENKPKIWVPLDPETNNGFESVYLNYNQNIETVNSTYAQLYNQRQSELELDNINLLYVALTRPVEQLHIISSKNESLKTYSGLLINYLKHHNHWDNSVTNYTFGKPIRTVASGKDIPIAIEQQEFISTPKKNHGIHIITNSGYLWDTVQQEAIEKGNLIHNIMSQIKTEHDIPFVISNFVATGIISDLQADDLSPIIKNIVAHPKLSYLFEPEHIIYNEKDIITKQGQMLRPDRLVINSSNDVVIVDYKTGNPTKKHADQLEIYSDALKEMGFKNIKKTLIYINDSIEIKEV